MRDNETAIRRIPPEQSGDLRTGVHPHRYPRGYTLPLAGKNGEYFTTDRRVGDSLPTGLKDVSQYPNLIYEVLKRNYSKQDIEKICGLNLLRVWSKVEQVASQK